VGKWETLFLGFPLFHPPSWPELWKVNEATIEKVHVILKENPQGVLYLRDELSGWMVQLEQRGRERDRLCCKNSVNESGTLQYIP